MNSDPRREEDGILLQCYRETGDERAFEELVHRHLDLVYGTAFRDLRSAADAEDVSQRVFISLARAGRSEPIRNLPAWLFTCSRREVQSMIRKESRRRIRESKVAEWAGLDNDSQSQSPLVDEEGPKPILREAMNRLPESDQEALFLRFHQNMSFAEIGSTLGIRQRAAQKRVYRAIERLRNDLKRRGAPVSAAVFSPSLFTAGMLKAPEGLAGPLAKTALSKSVTTSGWTASALLTLTKTSILLLGGAGL
ncbi:MAG: sigma-70 family RNA polymerase sigma factor, partial [Verrucomicrobiota bacterium]